MTNSKWTAIYAMIAIAAAVGIQYVRFKNCIKSVEEGLSASGGGVPDDCTTAGIEYSDAETVVHITRFPFKATYTKNNITGKATIK